VIVTGGNSGIGQVTARTLAAVGTPELIARSAAAQEPDLARRLRTLSGRLTGARSPLEPVPYLS
jgi:NAD(P)-dependent dehydrogenase (short-subunit alcohol dehydrogenase family)